jgi:tetratricopeptide (TPR) repeat protein
MISEYKTIQQLEDEFDLLTPSDNLAFIRFYENNKHSIENTDSSIDGLNDKFKLKLVCEYGMSLVDGGQYAKGVSILEKAIPMFENEPDNSKTDLKNNSYLEHLLWHYGFALWEIKQINDSIKIFKRLVNYYPENDKYRNWLTSLKASKIRKIANPIWIACFIWLLGDLIIFSKLDSQTRLFFSILGVSLLITVGIMELIIQIRIKKIKARKPNTAV